MREMFTSAGRVLASALRSPLFWLAVQLVVVWFATANAGRFQARRVDDTESYLLAAQSTSVTHALSRIRSIGYPSFLRMFRTDSGEIRKARVPRVQFAIFLGAVTLFWWALRRFTGSPWLALAGASPLLYAPITHLLPRIQPDFLAATMTILAFGALFLLARSRSWGAYLLLTLAVIASYQLRPAGVFLILLIPILGALFEFLGAKVSVRDAVRYGGVLATLTLVPFLAFATLRWVVVGHFGLVSFGGFNAAGMAVCFLDDALLAELPEAQARLAKPILNLRTAKGYEAMGSDDDPQLWFGQYSTNIFLISHQVVKRQIRRDDRQARWSRRQAVESDDRPLVVRSNERLSELAREISSRRPSLHFRWSSTASWFGLREMLRWPKIVWPAMLFLLSTPFLWIARRRLGDDPATRARARSIGCFWLAACTYFTAYLLLVSLVSFPFPRYLASIVLFLPSMFVMAVFEIWRAFWRGLHI